MAAAYWKALAQARDVAESDLRESLAEALYAKDEAQDAFDDYREEVYRAIDHRDLDDVQADLNRAVDYESALEQVADAIGSDEVTWDDADSLVKAIEVLKESAEQVEKPSPALAVVRSDAEVRLIRDLAQNIVAENALLRTQARAHETEIADLKTEIADLKARLDATRGLVESYSDVLAVAKCFVGRAKASGVKTVKTVRLVKL